MAPPSATDFRAVFQQGDDRVEVWDDAHFNPWDTLHWPEVRVLRYWQLKREGNPLEPCLPHNLKPPSQRQLLLRVTSETDKLVPRALHRSTMFVSGQL